MSDKIENPNIDFSGRVIAKNTIYNLLGNIIPVFFALALIPPLIKGLGTERFGILSIAWMIIGYFSFFDFGISRGLTKIISEKIGTNQTDQIPKTFWTSILLIIAVSICISVVLLFFIPSIVSLFKISKNLQNETTQIFYVLALVIPMVTTMAGLRGVLEAYQRFATINIMKVVLGIFSYLGPILVLIITNSLFWVIVVLIIMRFIIWVLYLLQCIRINDQIKRDINIDFISLKPVLSFSIWITIGNIIVPIILYSERFLIGVLISATAITFYVTPYEVVTRLLLISISLSGVLFPVFSASYLNTPEVTRKILIRGVKAIFLIIYPIVLIIITFAYEGIDIWLGKEFAINSSLILQFLSIGIFMNSMSLIPNIFFQGIGKPKVPTIINLIEFPFYLLIMWLSIKNFGIKGAAFTFMIMATIDAALMYLLANKMQRIKFYSKYGFISFLFVMLGLILPFLIHDIYAKLVYIICFAVIFPILSWRYFLSAEDKMIIISKIRFNRIISGNE